MPPPSRDDASYILRTLSDAGYEAFLVGGCVRDLLRQVPPHDYDICTSALPSQIRLCFRGETVLETGAKHGTLTLLLSGVPYEITTYREDGTYSDARHPDAVHFVPRLETDLARRDFTMNAIAMDAQGRLRDPFGGQTDIAGKLIRAVGPAPRRFSEDALRIMRALRFSAVLGFSIDPPTARAIHHCRALLHKVAPERIREELCALLTGAWAVPVLRQYPDVLAEFWPQLSPLFTLERADPWHCWGGWEHTLHALEASPPDLVLRLAVLLHDVGKPACRSTDEAGADHFYDHAQVGAHMAGEMLRALRFDSATLEQVVTLISHHGDLLEPTPKAVRRCLGRLGPQTFFQLLELQRCDNMGKSPELAASRLPRFRALRTLGQEILAAGECFSLRDLAVSGQDVMAAGIPQGPQVGQVLRCLLDQVIDGALPNDREILLRHICPR